MNNFIIGFILGIILASTYSFVIHNMFNPYYRCNHMYVEYDDISECIWILENE